MSTIKHVMRVVNCVLRDTGIGVIGGLALEKISESYERVVKFVPGGSMVSDYGFPYAVRRIIYPYPTTNLDKIVNESIGYFAKNVGFWGLVTVAALEGTYFSVKGIDSAYNWYNKRRQRENTEKQ